MKIPDWCHVYKVCVRVGGILLPPLLLSRHPSSLPPDGLSQTVYGQAVEPSYRATKSRFVRKCRFPSRGGLHRYSKDSYSYLMQIPDWCHVYKSNSPSSTRTCIAALASTSKINNTSKTSTRQKRRRNQIKKLSKQRIQLKDCKIPTIV